jgi:hypothetical protein
MSAALTMTAALAPDGVAREDAVRAFAVGQIAPHDVSELRQDCRTG